MDGGARASCPSLTEAETREAFSGSTRCGIELFPAEQARIIRLLVERVEIGPDGADIRLRVAGLAGPWCGISSAGCDEPSGSRMSGTGSITVRRAADDPATTGAED